MSRRTCIVLIVFASLLGLAAWAGGGGSGPAQAQDGERFIDLAVKLEVHAGARSDSRTDLYASNLGNQTAYDVEVEFEQLQPSDILIQVQRLPIGTIDADLGLTGIASNKFKWTIPVLPPQTEYRLRVDRFQGTSGTKVLIHEATIRSTTSHESPDRMRNNSARVWETWNTGSTVGPARPFYAVLVLADNRHPSPGDTVNFTVTASQPGESDGSQLYADACVNVWLTTGLTAGAPTFDPSSLTDLAYDTSNNRECGGTGEASGVFEVGGPHPQTQPLLKSMTLPVTVGSSATVSEQCLTAEIFATPPTGAGDALDDPSDNRVVYCLGHPPPEPFDSGEVRTWTLYACKEGIADNMCDAADEVDVRVFATIEGSDEDRVLDNATALIHVKDVPGRVFDANAGSVTDGTTVSWQTATDEDPDFTGTREGVKVGLHREPVNDYIDNWTSYHPTFKASGLNGGDPPGKLSIRSRTSGAALWALTSSNSWTAKRTNPFNLSSTSTVATIVMAEFEEPGTYVVDYDVDVKHATIDDDSDSETDVFSGTGRTIFHVGPIAELGVSDGGSSGDATADQVAFTVVGINNRDEDAENGKIVVELPAGATGLATVPTNTGAFDGTASPPTWTWDIHDLELADRRASKGLPEGEVVTLVVDGVSAGETANANVVYEPYEVCVASDGTTATATDQTTCEAISGANWHSGTVFDYNDDNDTATLTARVGGGAPGTPTLKNPLVYMPAVGFEWDEVDYIYGLPVKHYETEWLADGTSGWMELEPGDEILVTEDVDTGIEAGQTRYYRVRAVNQADVPGPWSAPMAVMVEQEVMATAGAPDKPVLTAAPKAANRREEILVSWTKPIENGSPIVAYTLEVSDTGRAGSWSDSGATLGASATSWTHAGLTGGTTKYYRLRATNMCDDNDPARECHSLWSDPVNATTDPPGQSGPPTNVQATPDGDSAIDVSWSAPADDGGTPITRYEVQWSADGMGGWNNAGSTPDGTTLTLKNTGMTFGTTRHYRVAARNSRGLSAWSDPPYASATTLAGVPGQPSLTVRATDANTIALTWTVPADNGSPIIRYEIQWSADGSTNSWSNLTNPGATDTSYDDTPLAPGTERHYRIRAVNGATPGEGSWSTARNATTPPAVPGAPTNVQAEANGENAINLTWEPPFDDGGADISGYELHVSTDNGTNYSRLTNPAASARSYTHGGLQPGDGRHYKVRAHNRAGPGVFSEPAFATTLTGVPAAPSLTAQANGASEIKLSWNKPDDRGSDILAYHLQQSDDGNDWYFLGGSISASDSEYVHTGLSGGTTKHYRIRAVNGNGEGEWSASRSARTDAGGPDAPVLTLTVAGDNQIDLSWTVPADNGSSIRGYWVERSVDGDAPWEQLSSSNSTTSYSDTDLYRGMTRYYRVAAFNGAGTGPYSDVKSATTNGTPATAPDPPTLLRFSAVGRNQVTIAWDPPADDGGAPVSGYEYEVARPCPPPGMGTCDFTGDDIKATSGTSASISGLSAQGDYYFQVRAVNPVGKGDWSVDIRATLYPSLSGVVQVSPVTVNVNEGATASYTVRLSHAPPHPVEVQITASGPSEADDLMDAVRLYTGHYLVPDGWTHAGGRDWSEFTHNWRQGVRVQFTPPEDTVVADDYVATFSHAVFAASASHLGLSDADWRQDWYDSTAYNLVECTASCNDANPANHTVKRHTLTGAGVKVTVRDND